MAVERRCSATSDTLATSGAAAPNQHGGSPCRLLDLTFVRYRRFFLVSFSRFLVRFSAPFAAFYREKIISGHFFIPLSGRRTADSSIVKFGESTRPRRRLLRQRNGCANRVGARVCGSSSQCCVLWLFAARDKWEECTPVTLENARCAWRVVVAGMEAEVRVDRRRARTNHGDFITDFRAWMTCRRRSSMRAESRMYVHTYIHTCIHM